MFDHVGRIPSWGCGGSWIPATCARTALTGNAQIGIPGSRSAVRRQADVYDTQ